MAQTGAEKRARVRPRQAEMGGGTVQTLDRAVALLRALAETGPVTLSELAGRTGMPPSSVHRLLLTLERHRMVAFNDTQQDWSIGVEAFRIGSAFAHRDTLLDTARDAMRGLVEATGETANFAIPDGAEVVFLGQVDTPNPIRAFFRTGSRAPMHASGIGKALLAEYPAARVAALLAGAPLVGFTPNTRTEPEALIADLEAVRARGWALDDAERHAGMRCVAAAVFDVHGDAVAGVSVSGPIERLGDGALGDVGAAVRRTAQIITDRTGGRPPRAD